ncbi:PAS domain S-box-containing protein [Halopenitus malekzadehii]|uniref:histidine kinase n=1 Tax=Halopenitus malekzadehii TaxID=1267564 RepID=A0A1H6IFU0_9EURY|nr:PAS domain S-box protein [Halopenitus malekzadehii]SEH45788.1 PAS domain S-box-containing protein [Halopenitus malekzadehii]
MSDGIRVLHVDDQPEFGELVATFLERVNDRITVVSETSVDAGRDRLDAEADRIDCIVSDYDMPGMNGIAFLETVREEYPALPFILFTGKGSEEVASEAIAAGATDYLQKRGGTEQYELLANRIGNAVEQYRYEAERNRVYQALETATQAIGLIDEDGHYIYLNEAYANLYGYEPADLLGEHWEMLYPEEETKRFNEEILPRLAEEGRWTGQSYGRHADGTTIPERLSLAQLDTGGHVCVVQDISEQRRRRQRQQRQREALLDLVTHEAVISGSFDRAIRQVTETATDVLEVPVANVWLFDQHGTALRCVDHYDREADTHRNGQELLAEEYAEYVSAIEDNRAIAATDARADDRTSGLTNDYLDPNDVSALLDATLRSEGEVVGVVCHEEREETREWTDDEVQFATDVAEIVHRALRNRDRREQQAELEFQRSLLHAQQDAILDGLIVVDENRRIVSYNDRFAELWDVPLDVLEDGDDTVVLDQVARQVADPEAFRDLVDRLYDDPTTTSRDEIDLADGRVYDRYTTPVTGEDGTHYGRLWMFRDVTERKHRERRLERQTEQFEELASVVSHDLQTPISTVRGRLELALEDGDADHIEAAVRALDRVDDLREDLVSVLRSREIVSETGTVDLAPLVGTVSETIEGIDGDRVAVVDEAIRVVGDENALLRLLQNLIGNSVEHGGSDVRVRIGALSGGDASADTSGDDGASVGAAPEPRGFFLEDSGPGIPPEDRDDVFEPGFTTKTDENGTGMGMASVEQIVDAHGWTITIDDAAVLDGVRFEIRFNG